MRLLPEDWLFIAFLLAALAVTALAPPHVPPPRATIYDFPAAFDATTN